MGTEPPKISGAEGTLTPITVPPTPNFDLRQRCIELLLEEKVEEFNRIRPDDGLDLSGINLSGKNLIGVNFDNVNLDHAILVRTNLKDATLRRVRASHTDFSFSNLCRTTFGGNATVRHAIFHNAIIKDADLQFCDFTSCEFIDAKLNRSNLSNSILADSKLTRAVLENTTAIATWFLGANLDNTKFKGANLERAYFVQSRGKDIDFSHTNLCSANFLRALYHGSRLTFAGAYVENWKIDSFGFDLYKQNGDSEKRMILPTEHLARLLSKTIDSYPPEKLFSSDKREIDSASLVHGIPGSNYQLYQKGLDALDDLVGLKEVKAIVHELADFLVVNVWRSHHGLPTEERSLHFAFTGNPGTGKTVVARIFGNLLAGIGFLPSDEVIETDRSGLVAGYVGQTEEKTLKVCKSALGKILFIDEAYQLNSKSRSNDFGADATTTLLKFMEDNSTKMVVIVAGYPELTSEFIKSNPGLESRFTEYLPFHDYSMSELTEIGKRRFEKMEFSLSSEFLAALNTLIYLRKLRTKESFANARDVRKIFQKTLARQSSRLVNDKADSREDLTFLKIADLPFLDYGGIDSTKIPWAKLRWSTGSNEIGFEQYPVEGEQLQLTMESQILLAGLVGKQPESDAERRHG